MSKSIQDLTLLIQSIHEKINKAEEIGNEKLKIIFLKKHCYWVAQRYELIKKENKNG